MKLHFLFCMISLLPLITSATIIRVPDEQTTIQSGINVADHGDTILVATGTYCENLNFNSKNIIVASFFLTTDDTSYISRTIIDGGQNDAVVRFENSEDTTAILSGFTITNGNLGGIHITHAGVKLSHLKIIRNSGRGGIYCQGDANLIVTRCVISENSSTMGGGIFFNGSKVYKSLNISYITLEFICSFAFD